MNTGWTVTELSRYIQEILTLDFELQDLWVVGEISNLTRARSGHLYFTLKDANAQLKCVMWRSDAAFLTDSPEHGDRVRAHGRISVYPAGGVYQLVTDEMVPVGRGDLHQQFEALKIKLEKAGLFDPDRKKPLPTFPENIGIVTSSDAAALRDILNVLSRRYPLARVVLAPTLVQGNEAPSQIVRALAALDSRDDIDVIILSRGGGSLEDLWAFNDERVAWAIYGCRHPVISGVGHETDFTISDFCADVRAPTPSAAAELATPDANELAAALEGFHSRLMKTLTGRIETARLRLDATRRALRTLSPQQRLLNLAQRLDDMQVRVDRAVTGHLGTQKQKIASLERALLAVNPMATLARGYAIVRLEETGMVIRNPAQVEAGDRLELSVHGGEIKADVV